MISVSKPFKAPDLKPLFLNHIEATGTQWLETDCYPSDKLRVEIGITPVGEGLGENAIFGSKWAVDGFFLMFYAGQMRFHTRFAVMDTSNFNTSGRNDIVCTQTEWVVNGNSYAMNGANEDVRTPIRLFSVTDGNGYANESRNGKYKLHYFRAYYDDVLYRHYRPCFDWAGIACAYEAVDGKYVYNGGTGEFIAGEVLEGVTI
jgi:hypothetical protein